MARAATTLDSFNAVAEPKRRDLLEVLARGEELCVGGIVTNLGWPQPQVSKHLRVLLDVGLVRVRKGGRRHFYSLNAAELKPIHEWVKPFERFWIHHLRQIKASAETKAKDGPSNKPLPKTGDSHG